jgi:hypothetical protein
MKEGPLSLHLILVFVLFIVARSKDMYIGFANVIRLERIFH